MVWSHDPFCWGGHVATFDVMELPCGHFYLVRMAARLLLYGWGGRAAEPRKKSAYPYKKIKHLFFSLSLSLSLSNLFFIKRSKKCVGFCFLKCILCFEK
jgi:hypothetical protein